MNVQERAPVYEALEKMRNEKLVPFDVPGHKRGRGNPALTQFLGEKCMSVDVNSTKYLDSLCHPTGIIREAEEIAALAFGAAHAFFMVGGTTSSIQGMILSTVRKGDKLILPRNVHQSVINALVISGAVPVYINPQASERLGIALGMSVDDVRDTIRQNPDAKAIFVNNPTYYGICSNLREIVRIAHENGLKVLVDEAHGAHFYFGEGLPVSAMAAGADMAAVSMHKSGGSLTQSSFLLMGPGVNPDYVRQVVNLTQTTSASYLLIASLDISRRTLALEGKDIFEKVKHYSRYARDEINQIGDYYAYAAEIVNGDTIYDFDDTKLSVNTYGLGLAGIEVHDLLHDEYDIQIEFGDLGNFLAYISIGDKTKNIERLIGSLAEIRRLYKREQAAASQYRYHAPEVVLTPQEAFYAPRKSVPLDEGIGHVCCEFFMTYPPGIPLLAPGERITEDIIGYIRSARDLGCVITGPQHLEADRINILTGEG
ncbi:MAG: aminotransferase class I/II-fold pyridoxal phosphate-dependent enzyme [Christensenellales bacterium]